LERQIKYLITKLETNIRNCRHYEERRENSTANEINKQEINKLDLKDNKIRNN
jgi:hypothetical protein